MNGGMRRGINRKTVAKDAGPPEIAVSPSDQPRGLTPIDLREDLWKYALLVMVQRPDMEISITALITELPKYIVVPDAAQGANLSRPDSKFSQLVRNLKSHKTNKTNFIYQGYAEATAGGFKATLKGLNFVRDYFKN